MRREIITWSVAAAVILGAFAATVLVLNTSLYSASGFVRGYLEAIARHDVDGALELAGAPGQGDASPELLDADAVGELSDIRLVSDTADDSGVHSVVYAWSADGVRGQTEFRVQQQGALLGLFPAWRFTESPFGVLQVTVLHGTEFTVNGVSLRSPAPDLPTPYLVFAPGSYEFSHDSRFLHADALQVTSSTPGAAVIAPVDVQPTQAMIDQVQLEIDDYLDACATQEVLFPTGCPFGKEMGNRIVTTPRWSIVQYPSVSLVPGPTPESWLMLATQGSAHLTVDVQSIFDGSVDTLDQDIPFSTSYVVTFLPGDQLLISAQD